MDALISHIAACCSTRQPAQSDSEDTLDTLAADMQQLRVGDGSPQAQDSSYRSPHVRSPRLRASQASPAAAAAISPPTAGLPEYRVFTFDIETTGFSTTKDAIIEMAVVDVVSGSSWSSLVKPEPYKKSSREAYKAHGISHYDLSKSHVPTLLQALKALHTFIHRHTAHQPGIIPLLVAHNGYTFDFRALAVAVHRQQQQQQQQQQQGGQSSGQLIGSSSSSSSGGGCGDGGGDVSQMMLYIMPEHLMVWDTLALARRLKLHKQSNLPNLQQATVREHFLGCPPSVVHRALADAQELALLLPHLLHWAAAQVEQGLDEKLLPRTFDGFVAAAAAAVGVVDSAAAVAADASSGSNSNLVAGESQTVSSLAAAPIIAAAAAAGGGAAGPQGARSAAGRASSSSSSSRRKRLPPAAAASGAIGAAGCNSGSCVQQQQLVLGSNNGISQPSRSAAVAAVAAIIIDSSSEGESEKMSDGASSPAAAAAAGLGVVAAAALESVTHSHLCTDNQVCVAAAHGSSSSSSSSSTRTAVSAVNCVAGIAQQQHTNATSSSNSSSIMFKSREAADQAACSIDAPTYSGGSSSSSEMERTAAARPPSRSSLAAAAAAAAAADDNLGSVSPVDSSEITIQDANTSSSSSSSSGGNSSGCGSGSARPGTTATANGLRSSCLGPMSHRSVFTPDNIMVRGRSVQIMSSSAFLDLVQATLSSSSSSNVTPDPDRHFRSDLIYLGQYIAGRSDSSSGFSEVLMSHLSLPVVFLLEGLVVSKNIKFSHSGGRIQALSLSVRCATRQRAQQQHIKQVAAAINSLTQLQQQQHQELYTCMVGNSLQVRLPIKTGAPYLDTMIRQVSNSSSSSTKRLIPVATPNLASVDATDRLQQILPVGAQVSVVLWPSCVWSNSKFRGVTLNCVELWLQE